jgi:hypothetical protein
MNDMKTGVDERNSFSERLRATLRDNKMSLKPAAFARGFNLRADTLAVTPHAARKWLVGEAIPAQERMLILSRWLNVSAAWLRFGARDEQSMGPAEVSSMSDFEAALMQDILALTHPSQRVVQQLVASLKVLEETVTSQKSVLRRDGV